MLFGKKILWEECADVGIPSTISLALTWYHSLAFNWRAGPSALDAWENRKLEPVVALQAPVGFWVDRPQSGKWNTAVGGIWQGKGSLARLGQYSLSDSEQVTSCDAPHTLLIQEMAWQWWAIISDLPRDKLMCILREKLAMPSPDSFTYLHFVLYVIYDAIVYLAKSLGINRQRLILLRV